jgi:hypothetical protein
LSQVIWMCSFPVYYPNICLLLYFTVSKVLQKLLYFLCEC